MGYPVSKATACRGESTQCTNGQGASFQCAESDSCCGGACVSRGDACCQNVLGNHFPCQVNKWARAVAVETRATRLAASAVGLLGSPRPGGTRSPRPPSAHSEAVQRGLNRNHTSNLFSLCMQLGGNM